MFLEQETEPSSPCLKYPPFPFLPVLSQINLSTRSLPLSMGFILMSSFHFSTVLQVITFLLFLLKCAIYFWWHASNYPLFIIIFVYGNEICPCAHHKRVCGTGAKLHLSSRYLWRSSSISRRFMLDLWAFVAHWIEGWLCPSVCMDAVERRKICCFCRESNHDSSVSQAIAKVMYRLSFGSSN